MAYLTVTEVQIPNLAFTHGIQNGDGINMIFGGLSLTCEGNCNCHDKDEFRGQKIDSGTNKLSIILTTQYLAS